MSLGYSNKVIKDKIDKGHYLSDAEKRYIDMEATQAAEMIIDRNKAKGSAFLVAVLRKAGELSEKVAIEERQQRGERTSESQRSQSDYDEPSNNQGTIFGDFYGDK